MAIDTGGLFITQPYTKSAPGCVATAYAAQQKSSKGFGGKPADTANLSSLGAVVPLKRYTAEGSELLCESSGERRLKYIFLPP